MKPARIFSSSLKPGKRGETGVNPAQAGFTLLELMAVLGLMVLLMGLVLPNLLHSWEREQNRGAVRGLTAALRTARSQAVTSGRRVRLFLNLRDGRYRLEGSGLEGALARGSLADARLVWQNSDKSQGYIAFYGDGSSSGGQLALVDPNGRRSLLKVAAITGKVSFASAGR